MLKFNVNSEYKMLYNVINEPLTLFDTSDIYIVYFKTGRGQFSVNNKEYPYIPDSVFVASFTDLCTINPSEESEIYVLEFSFDFIKSEYGKIVPIDSFPAKIIVSEADKEIVKSLFDMICNDSGSDDLYNIYSSGVFEQIIVCLLSNMTEFKFFDPGIRSAIVYIYENFRTNITKDEVANASGISSQSFGADFYKYSGIHFKEYLNNIRLNYAMKLIRCTDMNFTDICYECGFNSSQYFSFMFKEYFGVSPKNIRKEIV